MARGYPDYFGISMWPKYGTPVTTGGIGLVVPAGFGLTLIDILANGVFFCADIHLSTAADYFLSTIRLEIDNQLAWSLALYNITLDTSLAGGQDLMAVTYYDKLTQDVRIILSREVPFQTRIRIYVGNGSAGNINATPRTLHYVVT